MRSASDGRRHRVERGCRWLRGLALLPLLLALAACAPAPLRNPMASWMPSPNHDTRRAQLIVLHYTEQNSVDKSLRTLRGGNREGPVSAHYLIGGDGHIYQLVADSERAWHAGAGRWGTIEDVNSASIGIELDNDGNSAFAPAQIDALLRLLADLTTRLRIDRSQVIGHEDLAPTRRSDPGPRFPWQQLAEAGFGRWPRGVLSDPPPGFDPWLALAALGYPLDDRAAALRAFHHHYRANDSRVLDAQDVRVLYALVQPLMGPPSTTPVAPAVPR
ncbi:MAG: N-acetylmuramoyl-L-alanine amidase [Dyella sp.]